MKTRLFRIFAFVLPLLALLTGCKEDKNDPDLIILPDGFTGVVFTPGESDSQKLAFTSTADWSVALAQSGWVEITPTSGAAGKAEITIRLVGENTNADRETTATISGGSASVPFRIVRKASSVAKELTIVAPQKKIPIGKTVPLATKTIPENAIIQLVRWSSSDPSVLSVDFEGRVTAIAVGNATVTAVSGDLSAECPLEVTEIFTTAGDGKTYTFKDLSTAPLSLVSGVEAAGNGVYTVTGSIAVSGEDALALGDAELVKISNDAGIQIFGMLDFASEKKVTIQPVDASAVPAPFYFKNENNKGGGQFRNVDLVGCPIRYFGIAALTIEKCKFTGITEDGKLAAVNLGGSGQVTVSECEFIENAYPAIMGGSNMVTPLIFKNNNLYKNSKLASNRPQINITVAGDRKIEIKGNTIVGPGAITTNGGIAVSNLLGIAGANQVLIEGNKVSDCRYGITTNGTMDVRIIDNILENNKWDSNPMNGGSGVSIYNSKGGQKVYMSGNTIKGHLWGITSIGDPNKGLGPVLNLGNKAAGADNNPGGNVFVNNGNGGVLYDLYNNSPMTVYAQGNKWNVAVQDEASIEEVIFHKPDQANLGLVTFMPAAQ